MQLPHQPGVHRNAANPADRLAGRIQSNPADPVWRERCENLLPGGAEILPVLSSVAKRIAQKHRRLFNEIRLVWRQVNDARKHSSGFRVPGSWFWVLGSVHVHGRTTAACRLLPADCCLPTAACRLLPADCCLRTAACGLLPAAGCRHTAAYGLLPAAWCLPPTAPPPLP